MKIRFPSKVNLKCPGLSGLGKKLSTFFSFNGKPGACPTLAGQLPRLVTGVTLAVVILACLLLGGPFLAVTLAVVSTGALFEFLQMWWPGKTRIPTKIFGLAMAAFLFCPVGQPAAAPVLVALVFIWTAVAFLIDYGRGNDNANFLNQAALPLGFVYLPLLLHLALFLSFREQLLVIVAAAASDIAAYYVGCSFGKNKIWPRVSPQKSWEGSAAGAAACVLAVMALSAMPFDNPPLPGYGAIAWVFIGIFLAVAAQAGDFFESALKRSRRIKDSSELLPGHGGILDRIDSILFVLAAYWAVKLLAAHAAGIGKLTA